MNNKHIFISHSSRDDYFVKRLRESLEARELTVWSHSRNLSGGAKLAQEIEEAIEEARQFIAVISPNTINSPWVRKEIQKGLEVEQKRKDEGYRVIPVLLPGVEPSALELWFEKEPVGVRVEIKTGGLSEALPDILAGLGERLPADHQPVKEAAPPPVEELILRLNDLKIETKDGKRRAKAFAQLVYDPADKSARQVESKRSDFTAPIGVIEAEDLRWYLEEYFVWPIGVFKERAERIEAQLPRWGQDLYQAALALQAAQEAVTAWQQAGVEADRWFSVFVDSDLPEGSNEEEQAAAREAATELLSLPWELLHDGRGFLFSGKDPVRVRRQLPNYSRQRARTATDPPVRILLVSPRPEEEGRIGYIDHRISARPLVEAVEGLGELAELTVLMPPTFPALRDALKRAGEAGEPFDVVHFDGYGVFDPKVGLGGLCFEDPKDIRELENRASQMIDAEKLAEVIRDHRIPLVFLDACQSAKTEEDPTASVAAKLLEGGVSSIVAMSHSVLVETAHRFVKAFYQELAEGKRAGTAMVAGRQALYDDSYRGRMMGAGELHLQDWFVPVLYQEEQDPQLITKLPAKQVQQLQAIQRRLNMGELPEPPSHEFQGRSRELLALERLLPDAPYAVIRGQGGAGKTTLAVELARWLVRTGRFRRAAFVRLEQYTDSRTMLDSIGRQLLPEGDNYSVAQYGNDLKKALQPVERALADRRTIIVLDNLESVLPDQTGQLPPGAAPIEELFNLCEKLLEADPATRIVFTSREALPMPFDNKRREISLGALSREDAIKLVGEVMKQEGLAPKADDPGSDAQEIIDLVDAVNRHAHALVLLAREVARLGVRTTTENLHQLMAGLDRKHPGDRENSLYASVELSMRRLSPEVREWVRALGVFHGGANLFVLGQVLDIDVEEVTGLARQLIEVGLADAMSHGHLRLDPALPPFLLREMSETEQEKARLRWAEGMKQLTSYLYQQQFKDTQLAARLTLLELPNLMAMLLWVQGKTTPEEVVDLAERVESLLSKLGRPQALAQATRVREQAAIGLGGWSRGRYLTESANINRLLEHGDLQSAFRAAKQLLQQCLAAGEEAYPGAGYDIAISYFHLGRVLNLGGVAEAALSPLEEARNRFQALADTGNTSAERMALVVIDETGRCLAQLGRLDEATAAYQAAIKGNEKLDDMRGLAVSKGNLGQVLLLEGRYSEALEIYDEARSIFESLGEPGSIAVAWHQIGMVYRNAGQTESAERAYRQSLAIKVQQKDLAGEATSLGELGNLYGRMGRLEEAMLFYQQAADIYVKLRDENREGFARRNLATIFMDLQRYEEARRELLRAIECFKPFGHAAQPWTAWDILYDLEQATGNPQAAAEARGRAIECYLAYRRDGGQSYEWGAQMCAAVAEAIQTGAPSATTALAKQLAEYLVTQASSRAKTLLPKLQAILRGDRTPALAYDPNLNCEDAAELQLLLEALA